MNGSFPGRLRRRHRLDAADNASDMALRAARGALDDAGLLPAELTHVIHRYLHAGRALSFSGLHCGRAIGHRAGHGL